MYNNSIYIYVEIYRQSKYTIICHMHNNTIPTDAEHCSVYQSQSNMHKYYEQKLDITINFLYFKKNFKILQQFFIKYGERTKMYLYGAQAFTEMSHALANPNRHSYGQSYFKFISIILFLIFFIQLMFNTCS